jgi:hypothetical protein
MKNTAVEWLKEKWYSNERITDETFEKAKEMEKQQIVDAYQQGYNTAYFRNPLSKEQYYNETFKK